MKHKYFYFGLALLFIYTTSIFAEEKKDSINILWVGNSYTYYNDLPKLVQDIASTQKVKCCMKTFLKGGQSLRGHLKNNDLVNALKKGNYDYVILQEQSTIPAQSTLEVAEKVFPAAHALDSLAKIGSPDSHVIFYMTWGHKYGNRNETPYPLDNTYELMQQRLATSYLEMTYQNNAWCAPVGLAWKKVRQEHPEYILYKPDCYHPSLIGSYLAANVIFTTIFQKHYQTNFTSGLTEEQAEYLQQTAQNIVLENLKLINIIK